MWKIWSLVAAVMVMSSVCLADELVFERDPFDPFRVPLEDTPLAKGPVESLFGLFSKTKSTLIVKGIVWDETDAFAIVTYKGLRKVVSAGDKLDDKLVKDVRKEKIILRYNDQDISLMVGEDITL